MSHGETNWPFLMLMAFSVLAAATSRSVWRQRNAGICSTSTTSATRNTSTASWTSVSTGTPTVSFTFCRMRRPFAKPGPAETLERGAVRLVVRGLEDVRNLQRLGDAGDALRHLERVLFRFDHAGSGDEEELAIADGYVAEFERTSFAHDMSARLDWTLNVIESQTHASISIDRKAIATSSSQ